MRDECIYSKYARYFDLLYPHDKYERQANILDAVFARYSNRKISHILDLACGTGSLANLLVKRGYAVTGLELSKEMIAIAQSKVPELHAVQGRLEEFPIRGSYDAITCVSALNYLESAGALEELFAHCSESLVDGGLLIIQNALVRGRSHKFGQLHVNTFSNGSISLAKFGTWDLDEATNECQAKFCILLKQHGHTKFDIDLHRLRVFSTGEITSALQKSGLQPYVLDEKTLAPYLKSTAPALFVGRKIVS